VLKLAAQKAVCLDMFAGSGTVGAVTLQLNRQAVLIELNPQYCEIIEKRLNCTREPKRPQIVASRS
jgi:DNA modification methylase